MTSARVILVINKAGHSPFGSSKVPWEGEKKRKKEKVYWRLERPFTEQPLSAQLGETCNPLARMASAMREAPSIATAQQILARLVTMQKTVKCVYCFVIKV